MLQVNLDIIKNGKKYLKNGLCVTIIWNVFKDYFMVK